MPNFTTVLNFTVGGKHTVGPFPPNAIDGNLNSLIAGQQAYIQFVRSSGDSLNNASITSLTSVLILFNPLECGTSSPTGGNLEFVGCENSNQTLVPGNSTPLDYPELTTKITRNYLDGTYNNHQFDIANIFTEILSDLPVDQRDKAVIRIEPKDDGTFSFTPVSITINWVGTLGDGDVGGDGHTRTSWWIFNQ